MTATMEDFGERLMTKLIETNEKEVTEWQNRKRKRVHKGISSSYGDPVESIQSWRRETTMSHVTPTVSVARLGLQQRRGKPQCYECGAFHFGPCLKGSMNCYQCGLEGHYKRNFPQRNMNSEQKSIRSLRN